MRQKIHATVSPLRNSHANIRLPFLRFRTTIEMGQNNEDSNLLADDKLFEDDDDLSESLLHPQQRNAANARERARMRVLSRAFCRLKTTLPWVPPDTKLSKLDTLRLATSYIAHLRAVLKLSENEPTKHTSRQPANMVGKGQSNFLF